MKIAYKTENGFEEVLFEDSIPDGYTDITSVQNYFKWGLFYFKDYKWLRKRLQEFNFESLSEEEKIKVAQLKATSVKNCISLLGGDYEHWMTTFDLSSIECRKRRYAHAKTILMKNVDLGSQYQILGAFGTLPISYVEYGVEGTTEGDPIQGLFNFIEASGTYLVTGIKAMSLTMTGNITKDEMVIQIMNCLRNGNY